MVLPKAMGGGGKGGGGGGGKGVMKRLFPVVRRGEGSVFDSPIFLLVFRNMRERDHFIYWLEVWREGEEGEEGRRKRRGKGRRRMGR